MKVIELENILKKLHPDYEVFMAYSDDARTVISIDFAKGFESFDANGRPFVGLLLLSNEKHTTASEHLNDSNIPNN